MEWPIESASYWPNWTDDHSLYENSLDMGFLCNVYHYVEHHVDDSTKIKSTPKLKGRVIIVDFYHDEQSDKRGFFKDHFLSRERVIDNMEKARLALSKEHTVLPRQYFLEFRKYKYEFFQERRKLALCF